MKIVVCVKQVPEVTQVQVDPTTGTLIREGVQSILNPFCEYALDHAARLKTGLPEVHITAISMGPLQAKDALLRCLELGADDAVLVTDRKFAGADTWATSLTLAAAIRKAVPDFDLVFVGKQAIDGDTAQVGPELAEILGLPQITYGTGVMLIEKGSRVRVRREAECGYEVIESSLPALVSFSKGENVRRAPSLAAVIEARKKPVRIITSADLDIPEEELGLSGSFTQVVKIFPPVIRQDCQMIQNVDSAEAARILYAYLKERHFVE